MGRGKPEPADGWVGRFVLCHVWGPSGLPSWPCLQNAPWRSLHGHLGCHCLLFSSTESYMGEVTSAPFLQASLSSCHQEAGTLAAEQGRQTRTCMDTARTPVYLHISGAIAGRHPSLWQYRAWSSGAVQCCSDCIEVIWCDFILSKGFGDGLSPRCTREHLDRPEQAGGPTSAALGGFGQLTCLL